MPYELVKPEEEEKTLEEIEDSVSGKNAPPVQGYVPGMNRNANVDWRSMADAGYSDAFHNLKAKMDFTKDQYVYQLSQIPVRKKAIAKERRNAIITALVYGAGIPIGMWLLTDLFMNLSTISGAFAFFYLILKIAFFPMIFASMFFFFPPSVRTVVNCEFRYTVLNNPMTFSNYRESNQIVSVAEEEHFLRTEIGKHDAFEERIRTEGLDRVGGGDEMANTDELTERQIRILDEMQQMTIFKDYQARVSGNKKEGGVLWVFLGLGIGIAAALAGFAMFYGL